MDLEHLETELAPVFSRYRQDIVAAYLFGSMARGGASPLSDIDIAVLVRTRDKIDATALRFRLYADLSRKLKRNDVDIVLLNLSGNLILNDEIVRYGKLLYSTDDVAREEFELKTLHGCADFKFQRQYAMGV
jgi:predicted nucleotidyltransferase